MDLIVWLLEKKQYERHLQDVHHKKLERYDKKQLALYRREWYKSYTEGAIVIINLPITRSKNL